MTYEMSERPSSEESYEIATNTSDLTVHADRTCAATHVIAAGLAGHHIGAALKHLQSEWAATGKPRRATEAEITRRAADVARLTAKEKGVPLEKVEPDTARARKEAVVSYASRLRCTAHALRSWRPTLELVAAGAAQQGFDPDLLSPTLYHWLNPVCPLCDGLGKLRMAHAPALGQSCYHCRGTGQWNRPLGGYEVQAWLNRCIAIAEQGRNGKMQAARNLQVVLGSRR